MRRLTGAVLVIIGAGAFAACLRSVLAGVRDVMVKDGGSCGGGPYVIANQCSGGDIRLLTVGVVGGLIAAAIYASGASLISRSVPSAGLVAWVAAFGTLGWNFIGLVIHPPTGQGRSSGYLISCDRWPIRQPIVQAVIPPGLGTAPPATFGGWSADGTTALGVSASLVSLLR